WHFGPPGICDACGSRCGTMDQAGIVCYVCKAGVFMPRGFWQFSPCPACKGADSFCTCCEGRSCIATPREDIDVDELERFWQIVIKRALEDGTSLPAPVAALQR
ncbi:hypothetical protein, partial [Xanthomonas euvesicatoria]